MIPHEEQATAHKVFLSLIIPVFNECESIGPFIERIADVFVDRSDLKVQLVFVNDGSTDDTLNTILGLREYFFSVEVVDLSRNFGKEAALTAGLHAAKGQVVVPIDVDLQDPPELIFEMLEQWQKGFEVVLAMRVDRSSDSWLKRLSARWFYRIYNKISSTKLPENVGDFRLMDRIVVDALNQLPESQRFMKGLFAWIGFRTSHVEFVRAKRAVGDSRFGGWKLWNLALEGVTSFSTDPLRIWTYLGLVVSLFSVFFAIWIVVKVLVMGIDVPGYASQMVAVVFFGGLQLMGIGIVGEYLGRTYTESKRRPIYVVRKLHSAPAIKEK